MLYIYVYMDCTYISQHRRAAMTYLVHLSIEVTYQICDEGDSAISKYGFILRDTVDWRTGDVYTRLQSNHHYDKENIGCCECRNREYLPS